MWSSGAEGKSKNSQFKKGYTSQSTGKKSSQPNYLAKHSPKTNALTNQSSIKFLGRHKVLRKET